MNVSSPKYDLRANSFLKSVIIKNGVAEFTHKTGSAVDGNYRLTCPAFKDLEGKTVLINSAMEVFRGDRKIGDAKPAPGEIKNEDAEPEIE